MIVQFNYANGVTFKKVRSFGYNAYCVMFEPLEVFQDLILGTMIVPELITVTYEDMLQISWRFLSCDSHLYASSQVICGSNAKSTIA